MSNSVIDIIENNRLIHNTSLATAIAYNDIPIHNKKARYWLGASFLIKANDDPRARIGTFTTPWPKNQIHEGCKMPKLEFISDKYSDLMDTRALEINNLAKKKNKKIIVLWSGGIDSTAMLVSLLKNLNNADLKNVSVGMNNMSIEENQTFFLNHIKDKINIIELDKILINNEFLKNNILLQGDPGDGVNYPGTWAFNHMIAQGKHLNKFKDSLNEMSIGVNFGKEQQSWNWPVMEKFYKNYLDDGFGLWYINKIKDNIIECKLDDYITTVADFWWWHYFNIKWNHYTQSVLFNLRENYKEPLDPIAIEEFLNYTFYNNDAFQNWVWTNLKKLVREDAHKTLKLEARQYIFEYDKDQNYFDTKRKQPSPSMTSVVKRQSLIVFDKNYIGYENNHNNIHYTHILKILLEQYKG